MGKVPIRLNGVSAPELKETSGPQSKQFKRNLVDGKSVRCELDGTKTLTVLSEPVTLMVRTLA